MIQPTNQFCNALIKTYFLSWHTFSPKVARFCVLYSVVVNDLFLFYNAHIYGTKNAESRLKAADQTNISHQGMVGPIELESLKV
jgi:hypothetical protein